VSASIRGGKAAGKGSKKEGADVLKKNKEIVGVQGICPIWGRCAVAQKARGCSGRAGQGRGKKSTCTSSRRKLMSENIIRLRTVGLEW